MAPYILKSTLLLTLFYAFFILFMRKTTFFRFNRAALMLGSAACLLLPLVKLSLPGIAGAESLPHLSISEITVNGSEIPEAGHSPNWMRLFAALYLAGASAVFAATVLALGRTLSIIHKGRYAGTSDIRISIIDGDIHSFSFLSHIVISREDYEENPVILRHETAHVKCRHSADLLFFSAISVLHWFNPLVWIARTELKSLHEYEADEAVISQGIDTTHYQLLLVKKAVGAQRFQLASSFNHAKLKNRITMMQTKKTNKWARLGYLLCVPLLLAGLCFCTNLTEETPAKENSTQVSAATKSADHQSVSYNMMEEKPKFEGKGASEFSRWVDERLHYPESAIKAGIQGRVAVSFTIGAEGKVSDVKVLKGIDESLDAEAVRVISQSPDWTPGKKNGRPVPVTFTFPVIFTIK